MQLADYGNRIPSLTFEIFERDEPVPVGDIFDAASARAITGNSGEVVSGYALAGSSARDALSPLLAVLPIHLAVRDGQLALNDLWHPSPSAPGLVVAVTENRQKFDAPMQMLDPASQFPQSISLRYYDRARDFQAGVQQSERGGFTRNSLQIELPAVLDAADARRLVESKHLRAQHERTAWSGTSVLSIDERSPGDWFSDADGRKWRIEEIEHRFGSAAIKARAAIAHATLSGGMTSPGRNLPSPDLAAGETQLRLLDLPVFDTNDPGRVQIAVFAAGTESGWRRAALSLPTDTGLVDIGVTALPAVMGTSLSVLKAHSSHLIDETASLEIELLNAAMDIPERTGSPLDASAPYAWLDGEYMRFGHCEALGGNRFRLSKLLRGCFTVEPVTSYAAGARFVLLDATTARLITERGYSRGETATVEALGIGDALPVSAATLVTAAATTPLPPVHGIAQKRADGSIAASWIRRSRIDFGWRDGVDQALVEDKEQYLVSLYADLALAGEWLSNDSNILLDAATISGLNLPVAAGFSFAVCQMGRHARSDPHFIAIS